MIRNSYLFSTANSNIKVSDSNTNTNKSILLISKPRYSYDKITFKSNYLNYSNLYDKGQDILIKNVLFIGQKRMIPCVGGILTGKQITALENKIITLYGYNNNPNVINFFNSVRFERSFINKLNSANDFDLANNVLKVALFKKENPLKKLFEDTKKCNLFGNLALNTCETLYNKNLMGQYAVNSSEDLKKIDVKKLLKLYKDEMFPFFPRNIDWNSSHTLGELLNERVLRAYFAGVSPEVHLDFVSQSIQKY